MCSISCCPAVRVIDKSLSEGKRPSIVVTVVTCGNQYPGDNSETICSFRSPLSWDEIRTHLELSR
jgi:hypothetical protein